MKATEKKTGKIIGFFFFFLVEAFFFWLRKVRLYRERKRREAAAPHRTYSSPPFCPCAPFCTAPWVWLSSPGPHPMPQKWDLARPSLHRGNRTRPKRLLRNCRAWCPALPPSFRPQPGLCLLTNRWASRGWPTNAWAPGITSSIHLWNCNLVMQKVCVWLRSNYICVLKHYSLFRQDKMDKMQASFVIIEVFLRA